MNIRNLSTRYSDAELAQVIRLVQCLCDDMGLVDVLVTDQDVGFGRGKAYLHRPLGGPGSLVQVCLAPKKRYQQTSRAVPMLPEIRVKDWKEALVLLLAHELCHIDQFRTRAWYTGEEVHAEIQAESFARDLLHTFRAAKVAYAA